MSANLIAMPKKNREPTAIDSLPFVGPFPNGDPKGSTFPRCFWANVESTGDLLKDEQLGKLHALNTIHAMVADSFPPLLFWILEDMERQQCPERIKISFVHVFAEAAMEAAG